MSPTDSAIPGSFIQVICQDIPAMIILDKIPRADINTTFLGGYIKASDKSKYSDLSSNYNKIK